LQWVKDWKRSPDRRFQSIAMPRRRAIAIVTIQFGREICSHPALANDREWLVTNGTGSFASGTISGMQTRRYHGLLVAALKPPLGHTLLVSKLDTTAQYNRRFYPLFVNRWLDGTVEPDVYPWIERFYLDGSIPVWHYAFADALLEKRIWMHRGENTTYIRYQLRRASLPVTLSCKGLATYRDRHDSTRGGDRQMRVDLIDNGVGVTAFTTAIPYYLLAPGCEVTPAHDWHYGLDLAVEGDRGLDRAEDALHVVTFKRELHPGDSLTLVVTTHSQPILDGTQALEVHRKGDCQLLKLAKKAKGLKKKGKKLYALHRKAPQWVDCLVLAADRFVVNRPSPENPDGKTIVAGYHWFGDWGRDLAIALSGLTLCTGRPKLTRTILQTFARYCDRGMIPNRFPDAGETPDYNTVDATLWYVEAVRAYYEATKDKKFLKQLWPLLVEIVEWHAKGTRYNIHVDPADGLLYAGEPGVQLTWMDAKVGDWVVTPRIGKPIEVNALWYNALQSMVRFGKKLGKRTDLYRQMAQAASVGFERFWNESAGYCDDVIDTPEGRDSSLRPNQIFAVSLPYSPLSAPQQRAVVEVCGRSLLSSYGLRSLSPHHRDYVGHYGGDVLQRDGAYHQGTVWGWLLGHYILAEFKVYGDRDRALSFLDPIADSLIEAGVGSLSEIFDGDPPFRPQGAIAQAWTVAEVLRVAAFLKIGK
jgi:predicted glycogen debranching enzyme